MASMQKKKKIPQYNNMNNTTTRIKALHVFHATVRSPFISRFVSFCSCVSVPFRTWYSMPVFLVSFHFALVFQFRFVPDSQCRYFSFHFVLVFQFRFVPDTQCRYFSFGFILFSCFSSVLYLILNAGISRFVSFCSRVSVLFRTWFSMPVFLVSFHFVPVFQFRFLPDSQCRYFSFLFILLSCFSSVSYLILNAGISRFVSFCSRVSVPFRTWFSMPVFLVSFHFALVFQFRFVPDSQCWYFQRPPPLHSWRGGADFPGQPPQPLLSGGAPAARSEAVRQAGVAQRRVAQVKLFFFFEGLYFQEKLYLKNFNIKNKDNKISQGRGNSLRNEVRGWEGPYSSGVME